MGRARGIASVVAMLGALVLGPGLTPAYAAGIPLTGYGTSTGGTVCDTINEINPAYSDVACASGSSAFVGSDGSTLAFGLVTEVDPRTTQNGGPLESTAYVVAIAVNGTQVATVGVDGKQVGNTDYVYAKCFGNTTLTYNKLVTTATTDGSFVVTPMAGTPYYRVDFTVPLSALSGCGITSSTSVQLYYGSSQAANLDVINKDFFREGDAAVTFAGLSTVTFGGSLGLTKTATWVAGPNPPGPGQTSTYDLAVKASNTSIYPLTGVQVLDDLPAGVTIISRTATTGTPTVTGQHIDWSGFNLTAGSSATMTIRVSITPPSTAVGSTYLLNAGATGSAARGDGVAVTAASNSVSTGVVSGPVLTLTKTASPTFVAAGGVVSYTITVGNGGTAAASVTAITDTLPAGFAFVAGSTAGTLGAGAPTVSGSTLTWSGPFTLAVGASRTLTFSATAGATPGSFTNTATATASNAATISTGPTAAVTVDAPPSAQADSATTTRATPVSINVLANDTDPDANPLSISAVGAPSNGTAVLDAATGRIVYTPAVGFSGSATFSYTVSDGFGGSSTATVTVTVTNGAPVANGDTLTATPGTAAPVNVLANDTDPEGDSLTVTFVSTAGHGSVMLSGGNVSYTADPSYVGTDSFTYTVSDGHGGSATASVTVTVPNTAPTAVDDDAAGLVDNPITVPVLSNDTDPNAGQTLTVTGATQPAHGVTTVNANGTITYTPGAGYAGPDSFEYTIDDGAGGTDVATVTVTVTAGAPLAVDDFASTAADTDVTVSVLANDVGTGTLNVVNLTQPVVTPPVGPPGGPAGLTVLNADGSVTYTPTPGFSGTASFTYSVTNGAATSPSPATVTITVLNAPPVAVDDSVPGASRAAAQSLDVLANDTDANGDSLTITAVGNPSQGGTVTLNGAATGLVYTPAAGFTGTETFTYTITDGSGGSDTATVTVTVVNAAPVANDDALPAVPGVAVPVDVTANDTDPDGDTLTVTAVGPATHGTPTLAAGAVTYTADTSYVGTDSFTYTVSDGNGGIATATVAVTVPNSSPVAVSDSASVDNGSSTTVSVLANDTDPNAGQPLTVTSAGPAAHGTVTVNLDGTVTYAVTGSYQGPDSFDYTISDGSGGTDTATVSITVTGRPPVANGDVATTPTDTDVTVAVLANDTDADGDTLAVVPGSLTSPFAGGVTQLNPNGTITYTPATGYAGVATFSYSVTDGTFTDTATITVTVLNADPVANGDVVTGVPGVAVPVDVLGNDTDPNGDTLTVTAVGAAAHGTATLTAGAVSYTADPAYVGNDSFTYTITDGNGGTDTATVSVTVGNTSPVAVDDAVAGVPGVAVPVDALANDSDPNGDTLTVTAVGAAAHGTATLTAGAVSYTADPAYVGNDSFRYTISDGNGGTDTATVSVTVGNTPPVAVDDAVTGVPGVAVPVDVLANDTDPNGDTLTVTAVGSAAHGTATLTAGAVSYTASSSYVGPDSFTYTISDGNGGTASATVSVTIPNTAPDAVNDSANTAAGADVTVAVLANDTDANGNTLAVVPGSVTSPAPGGSTVLNPDGTIAYSPPAGFAGTVTFDYTVTDGTSTDTATVTVTVGNAAPVAVNDSLTGTPGLAVPVDVLANDTDANGDTLTVTAVTASAHGTASLAAGAVTYVASSSYVGPDSFTYTISDGNGSTDTATVSVTIPNTAPTAVDDSASTPFGTPVTAAVLTNDTDPNTGQTLSVTSTAPGAHGTVVTNANGTLTYTPAAGYAGPDSFDYTLSDGAGGNDVGTVTVTVAGPVVAPLPLVPAFPAPSSTPASPSPSPSPSASVPAPVNHPPAYTDAPANTTQTVAAGEPLAPLAATDPDGNQLSYALISGDLPTGVQLQADGTFSGEASESGSYPVVLRVCDNGSPVLCTDTHLTIEVAAPLGSRSNPPVSPAPVPAPQGEGSARIDPAPARPLLPRTGAPLALLLMTGLGSLLTGFGIRYAGRAQAT